jgi:methylmalonyl-CoA mutase C-terminal domain/subunit
MSNPVRVLIAKPGLDGHDRGAKVVALALRDAGFEVIYSGLHQSIDQIVETGIQEDVDVIGLSILSGAHIPLAEKLVSQLDSHDFRPLIVVGGNIPKRDIEPLKSRGVHGVFPTGSHFNEIVKYINEAIKSKVD